jgi:predicted enzyme related to lactoylglutathione lyase
LPTIVHFEIPADDVERSKKFYNDLFGWKIEKWPGKLTSTLGSDPVTAAAVAVLYHWKGSLVILYA